MKQKHERKKHTHTQRYYSINVLKLPRWTKIPPLPYFMYFQKGVRYYRKTTQYISQTNRHVTLFILFDSDRGYGNIHNRQTDEILVTFPSTTILLIGFDILSSVPPEFSAWIHREITVFISSLNHLPFKFLILF